MIGRLAYFCRLEYLGRAKDQGILGKDLRSQSLQFRSVKLPNEVIPITGLGAARRQDNVIVVELTDRAAAKLSVGGYPLVNGPGQAVFVAENFKCTILARVSSCR
jgi:hypothetical protein